MIAPCAIMARWLCDGMSFLFPRIFPRKIGTMKNLSAAAIVIGLGILGMAASRALLPQAPAAPVGASVNVTQHHNNPSRDGLFIDPAFTPAAAANLARDVNFNGAIVGNVYAQPLYVEGGPNGPVVIAATESNNVYALDAITGAIIWQRNLGAPAPGMGLITGGVGITGTPVIDLPSRSLFLVSVISGPNNMVYSLNVDTGATNPGFPIDVNASFPDFSSSLHMQRGALMLLGNKVYIPYGGYADQGNYHGRVLGVSLDGSQPGEWVTTSLKSGIWNPGGIASDGTSLFVVTGNAPGGTTPWGGSEAVIRLQPGPVFSGLTTDFWAPTNWPALDSSDVDLGGSNAIILDVPGATPSALVLAIGKDRNGYLLDRANLGGIGAPIAQGIVSAGQVINSAATYRTSQGTFVVLRPPNGTLTTFKITATNPPAIATGWTVTSAGRTSPFVTSTDGINNPIVWAYGHGTNQRLFGYNGETGAVIFAGGGANDTISGTRTFNTGIAARGRIYIAGDNKVYAFSVPTGATPTPSPTASPSATPTATATATPTATATATATATIPPATPSPSTAPIADVVLNIADSPDPVQVGQNLTYTITVSVGAIGGMGHPLQVIVNDTLPPSVTLVSATPSQGGCSGTGGGVTCSLGTLPANSSATVVLVVTPTQAGPLSNTAAAASNAKDPNVSNNSATATTTVVLATTPTPTLSPGITPSPTPTPTATATATATIAPTATPSLTPGVTATPSATPAQAQNLSTRMNVQTGSNVAIGGFIITGSAPKHLLLRAIGPSLTQLGIANALADPVMELHGPGGFATIANDNWRDDPVQESAIIATGIPPSNNLESAIDVTVLPGAYTAIVSGKNNTTGVGLIEVYDLSQAVPAKLANISTRAFVGTGSDIVIAGFILGGNSGDDTIIARGIGPSLVPLGIANALANPTLELRDSNGAVVIANNDWQDNAAQAAELTSAGLAPTNDLESGIATALPPGLYTALLAGMNNGTGVGLVEVYDRGAP
jgi:uncharacterized repeat protein (TIGR01451 family)